MPEEFQPTDPRDPENGDARVSPSRKGRRRCTPAAAKTQLALARDLTRPVRRCFSSEEDLADAIMQRFGRSCGDPRLIATAVFLLSHVVDRLDALTTILEQHEP